MVILAKGVSAANTEATAVCLNNLRTFCTQQRSLLTELQVHTEAAITRQMEPL